MGYGFKAAAGGGSNLNFSVKTYATEETLLADAPKENTIGVVTYTAVPKWGFYAAKPETPAEGELCFPIGTESSYAFIIFICQPMAAVMKSEKDSFLCCIRI